MTRSVPYLIIAVGVLSFVLFRLANKVSKQRRRAFLRGQPFPPEWRAILEKESSLYRALPTSLKDELHVLIRVFLAEKAFEGCQGLEVTEPMRLIIASQACLLLVNNDRREKEKLYPTLSTILVYPSVYVVPGRTAVGAHQAIETTQARLGESWNRGEVVLVWDRASADARNMGRGENVVLHEFAHQLDQEDGSSDGAPFLKTPGQYVAWARVLGGEFRDLQENLAENHPTLLREYGATNPAEFFAVATETFFERPERMKKTHPELYEQLQAYYGLDPEAWIVE
jgi:Mlc titration factor MtfA (ptsG expression regulator)